MQATVLLHHLGLKLSPYPRNHKYEIVPYGHVTDETPRAVAYLLRRMGRSPQVPVHRAAERDPA